MATYRWPGSTGKHTISWEQHQANVAGKALAAPGSPAAAGTAPASSAEVPAPLDTQALAEIEGLGKTQTNTTAGLGQQRTGGLLDYGYSESNIDPTTGVGTLTFDPNNPFSKASLLKKNYDVSRASTGNQMAAGGGLYSGAYQTAQDSLNRGQLGDEDTLQKSLGQFLIGNTGATKQAGIDYESGFGQAQGGSAARALDNPLYTPIADTAAPAAPAVPTIPKPPVKPAGGIGRPVVKRNRPANQASSVGSTRRPRVVVHTRGVNTP